jgi:hypothetical protein
LNLQSTGRLLLQLQSLQPLQRDGAALHVPHSTRGTKLTAAAALHVMMVTVRFTVKWHVTQ